jgi:hypothetical protein
VTKKKNSFFSSLFGLTHLAAVVACAFAQDTTSSAAATTVSVAGSTTTGGVETLTASLSAVAAVAAVRLL